MFCTCNSVTFSKKKKKKMTARGATELREFANKGTEAICIFTPN